jgi:hypothetical protein
MNVRSIEAEWLNLKRRGSRLTFRVKLPVSPYRFVLRFQRLSTAPFEVRVKTSVEDEGRIVPTGLLTMQDLIEMAKIREAVRSQLSLRCDALYFDNAS